ncbi:META domain-containing protein [Arthrobacter sp. MYb227]|uniref:META domain-containing protein n=1 Tax=Arthrobacter sp. MYb227 TaxID=1848601 RepID=UPI000CFD79E2|nr:META domain-containing protein [Arthrobacter sp. MYb227]PQZ87750.1 META domain-containing protein [Arthrobacter sp. MYb227]
MSETSTPVNPTPEPFLGAWGREERGQASLEFVLEDFRVSGSDGCNRIFGSWELKADGSVELKQMASTMMFCQDIDTWISDATTVTVVDAKLVVSNAEATVLGSLERRETAAPDTETE